MNTKIGKIENKLKIYIHKKMGVTTFTLLLDSIHSTITECK